LPRTAKPAAEPETRAGLPILAFASAALFERWLVRQPAESKGLWVRLAKQGAGVPSVDKQQAIEVALYYDKTRKARIEKFVAMLARGEVLHPA